MISGTPDSAYYYSSYNIKDESKTSDNKKIMILGGGPNRIGQGIHYVKTNKTGEIKSIQQLHSEIKDKQ